MLKRAVIWRLIRTNPTNGIDRPRLNQPEMNILTEPEIDRLLAAYDQLAIAGGETEYEWWQLAKSIVITALGTGMRRGELLGLKWRNVNLLERVIHVREAHVRGHMTTPKSRASRRTVELGPHTQTTLEQRWQTTRWRAENDYVFCHPHLGSPLDPGKLARSYMRPALAAAGIEKPFRPFHDLRHTSLTHTAAAGNPHIYVQARAGHAQASITERYLHATQTHFPDAVERSEQRIFGQPKRTTPPW
jgi:integrase